MISSGIIYFFKLYSYSCNDITILILKNCGLTVDCGINFLHFYGSCFRFPAAGNADTANILLHFHFRVRKLKLCTYFPFVPAPSSHPGLLSFVNFLLTS